MRRPAPWGRRAIACRDAARASRAVRRTLVGGGGGASSALARSAGAARGRAAAALLARAHHFPGRGLELRLARRARRAPAALGRCARRELEAVAPVLLEHELRRERPPEARGEVGEQLGLALAQVDERLV